MIKAGGKSQNQINSWSPVPGKANKLKAPKPKQQ
jgi:hypothetical protein